jgi:hypothetical protein
VKQRRGIRSPRKVVIRAGIFLLLGAIVNIAVAWWCALWMRDTSSVEELGGPLAQRTYPEGDTIYMWELQLYESPGLSWANGGWGDVTRWKDRPPDSELSPLDLLPGWASQLNLAELRRAAEGNAQSGGVVVGRGWPMVCLTCRCNWLGQPPFYVSSDAIDLGWPGGPSAQLNPADDMWLPRLLPLRPYVVGFAINTLFYAAILWLLFAAPFALRRWRRIRRGLCPACAYPVGASDLCSECGKPVPASTT